MEIVFRGNIKCMREKIKSEAGKKKDDGGKYMVQVTQGENKMHEGGKLQCEEGIWRTIGVNERHNCEGGK